LGISPLGPLVVRFHACVYREVSIEYLTPWLVVQEPLLTCNYSAHWRQTCFASTAVERQLLWTSAGSSPWRV